MIVKKLVIIVLLLWAATYFSALQVRDYIEKERNEHDQILLIEVGQ